MRKVRRDNHHPPAEEADPLKHYVNPKKENSRMDKKSDGRPAMDAGTNRKRLNARSYLVEVALDKEWERRRQQESAEQGSGLSETKERGL